MNNFIQKNKSTLIFLVVIIIIFAGLIVLSSALSKKYLEEISYEEYVELKKDNKNFMIYIGEKDESYDKLLEVAKTSSAKSYFVDAKKLTKKQKEETLKENNDLFEVYEKDKETYSYNGDYTSYKFINSLMQNDIIDKKYVEISIAEYLEIIKSKGTHLMFIGSATCGYCTMFKDSVNEALKDYDFEVYYIDLAREDITEEEREALYASDSYFSEEQWGTPLSFLYKDGKRVNVLNGYVETSELVQFLKDNKVIK